MSKFDFAPYQEFIETGLYEIMFQKMKENAQSQVDEIETQKYLNTFFMHIFSKEFVKKAKKDNYFKYFYPVVFKSLNEDEDFNIFTNRIGRIISEETANDFFETLIKSGREADASLLLPYISKNAEDHFSLFVDLIADGQDKLFCNLVEQMNNIHFGNDVLLQITLDSNPSTANYLINKHKFDINAVGELPGVDEDSYSFVHSTIIEDAHGHLKNLLTYHLEKINFNPVEVSGIRGKIDLMTFVLSQDPSYEQLKMFLSPDLSGRISADHIRHILEYMMTDKNIIKFSSTDVFEDLFAHPNFDAKLCAPNQNFFYYEIVAALSKETQSKGGGQTEERVRSYLKVMSAYLHNAKPEDMPNATSFNPLGAIVWRATFPVQYDAEMRDAVLMVAKKFPMLINAVNPNGKTALDLTKDGSTLQQMLKEMGAKPAPSGLRKWFGGDITVLSVPDTIKPETFKENVQRNSFATGASIPELLLYFKEDQEKIWKDFKTKLPEAHPELKEKYDELFYKGTEFLEFAKGHPDIVINSYEEISFITNGMIKYVRDILDNYESVVNVANRLSNSNLKIEKEQAIRAGCVNQMNQMSKQLTVSIDKIYQMATEDGMEKMNVTSLRVAGKVQNMNNSESVLAVEKRIKAQAQIQSAQNELDLLRDEGVSSDPSVQLFNDILDQKQAEEENKPRTVSFRRR